MTGECEEFAILDLAALGDGNLSREGQRRLAHHATRCHTCRELIAMIADEVRGTPASTAHHRPAWSTATADRDCPPLAKRDDPDES